MKVASMTTLVLVTVVASSVATASLDKDLVRGRIRAHNAEYRACYEAALKKDPKLEGKVVVKFVVEKDGKVSSAKSEGMPAIDDCISRAIAKIQFPSNTRGSFTVSYPFTFSRDPRR